MGRFKIKNKRVLGTDFIVARYFVLLAGGHHQGKKNCRAEASHSKTPLNTDHYVDITLPSLPPPSPPPPPLSPPLPPPLSPPLPLSTPPLPGIHLLGKTFIPANHVQADNIACALFLARLVHFYT